MEEREVEQVQEQQQEQQRQEQVQEKVETNNSNIDRSKKRRKRLFLLLLLLLVTGIMLGTATFAWFTANKTVSVNDIQVNVAAQNGIQISVDGTSWKSIVQTSDLLGATTTYSAAVNQIPSSANSLAPVSTIGAIDSTGKMEMYLGTVEADSTTGNYMITAVRSTETAGATTGAFIAFDIFLKVDANTPIYFTPNTRVVASDANDTGIKNATRMGFVILGNTTSGDTLANIQALNAGTSAVKYIYEPNYDVHTAAAVNHAYDVYGITTTTTGGSLLPYSGVKAAIPASASIPEKVSGSTTHAASYSTYFGAVTVDYYTAAGFSTNFSGFTLSAGITKVRVYMWIEGQDVDCENSASGGNITYGLQITTENTPSGGSGGGGTNP